MEGWQIKEQTTKKEQNALENFFSFLKTNVLFLSGSLLIIIFFIFNYAFIKKQFSKAEIFVANSKKLTSSYIHIEKENMQLVDKIAQLNHKFDTLMKQSKNTLFQDSFLLMKKEVVGLKKNVAKTEDELHLAGEVIYSNEEAVHKLHNDLSNKVIELNELKREKSFRVQLINQLKMKNDSLMLNNQRISQKLTHLRDSINNFTVNIN